MVGLLGCIGRGKGVERVKKAELAGGGLYLCADMV